MLSNGRSLDRALLECMSESLAHRGPDAAGVWLSGDGAVGLAHRRLSIIDLSSAADQPMCSEDGLCVLVFNGELYNYRELRRELRERGRRFTTDSDTEVVLQAYCHWGEDCPRRLDGMFAFAVYDIRRRILFAARDRCGEKPFHYRESPGTFSFASELKALLADAGAPRTLDPEALNHYLAYGAAPGNRCLLAGYRKLLPGHALRYDLSDGTLVQWMYWDLPDDPASPTASAEELVEDLLTILGGAVERQLVADVPVGVLLSGGLDSGLLTALAAERSPGRLKTYTISFAGHGRFDEAPHARLVADHFGTEHHELRAEPATVEILPRLIEAFDEPLGDHAVVPMFQLSELVRLDVKVALGGDGGDEVFGGYPHHGWLQRLDRGRRRVPGVIRRLVGHGAARLLPPGSRGRNHLIGLGGSGLGHVNLFFDETWRTRLLGQAVADRARAWCPEAYKEAFASPARSLVSNACAVDFKTTLADTYLVKVDRASMAHSLEIRSPWLARDVVEFGFGQLPAVLRATASARKVMPRRLAARLLPSSLDIHRKQGLTLPFDAWFQGEWGSYLSDLVNGIPPEIIDPCAAAELLVHQRRGRSNGQRIFALAMFELWRRRWGVSP